MVGKKNSTTRDPLPTEQAECTALARWLDRYRICYTHVPMGGARDRRQGATLRAMGAKPGVPDYLIFTPPPSPSGKKLRGVAVEMKRRDGGRLSDAQHEMANNLGRCGWLVIVAHGAEDAVERLRALGYGEDP